MEDLVRFINMESGSSFRNRDVYLIYKKLWSFPSRKVNYESIIDTISTTFRL